MSLNIKRSKLIYGEKDLIDFENRINRKIPADFKDFISHYGLGRIPHNQYRTDNRIGIKQFLSINGPNSIEETIDIINRYDDRMARDFLPIAEDGSGNYVILRLSDASIWFWIHDVAEGEDPYSKLADNFTDFLANLDPIDVSAIPSIPYQVIQRKPQVMYKSKKSGE